MRAVPLVGVDVAVESEAENGEVILAGEFATRIRVGVGGAADLRNGDDRVDTVELSKCGHARAGGGSTSDEE